MGIEFRKNPEGEQQPQEHKKDVGFPGFTAQTSTEEEKGKEQTAEPEVRITNAIKNKLEGPGLRLVKKRLFEQNIEKGFVNVTSEDKNFHAHIHAERNPYWGDHIKVNWLDRNNETSGLIRVNAETGEELLLSIIRTENDFPSWQEDVADWEEASGADVDILQGTIDFRHNFSTPNKMTPKEKAQLAKNLETARYDTLATEKALTYMKQKGGVKIITMPSQPPPDSSVEERKEVDR